jgi:hypothetical protein
MSWTEMELPLNILLYVRRRGCKTLNTPNEDEEMCTGEIVRRPRVCRMQLGWRARTSARTELVAVAMGLTILP